MAIQISLRWVWDCLSGTGLPPAVAILQPSRFQIGLQIEASAMRMLIKAANQLQWLGHGCLPVFAWGGRGTFVERSSSPWRKVNPAGHAARPVLPLRPPGSFAGPPR